jgi:hypothetical protein
MTNQRTAPGVLVPLFVAFMGFAALITRRAVRALRRFAQSTWSG